MSVRNNTMPKSNATNYVTIFYLIMHLSLLKTSIKMTKIYTFVTAFLQVKYNLTLILIEVLQNFFFKTNSKIISLLLTFKGVKPLDLDINF